MTFLQKSLNLTRLIADGSITDDQLLAGLKNTFKEDLLAGEVKQYNIGFCGMFDMNDFEFGYIDRAKIEHFYVFGVRIDTRSVPGGLLRNKVEDAKKEFLEINPDVPRLPQYVVRDITDIKRRELLLEAQPSPAMYQVAWDTETNELLIDTRVKGVVENIKGIIRNAFPDVEFMPETPIGRAMTLTDKAEEFNQCESETDRKGMVEENIGLWQKFFAWLLYRSYKTDAVYKSESCVFMAYLDKKFVLNRENEYGKHKLTITGVQDKCREIRTALDVEMKLDAAQLQIKTEGLEVSVQLDTSWLGISKAKIPFEPPKPSGDLYADNIASFIIRMDDIAVVQERLDALVVRYFEERSSENWKKFEQDFTEWVGI